MAIGKFIMTGARKAALKRAQRASAIARRKNAVMAKRATKTKGKIEKLKTKRVTANSNLAQSNLKLTTAASQRASLAARANKTGFMVSQRKNTKAANQLAKMDKKKPLIKLEAAAAKDKAKVAKIDRDLDKLARKLRKQQKVTTSEEILRNMRTARNAFIGTITGLAAGQSYLAYKANKNSSS